MTSPTGARRFRCWVGVLVAAAALGTGLADPGVRAQTAGSVTIELVRQPLFYRAGDDLGLRLRISNGSETSLEGFQVQVAVYEHATGRIDLHESFDGPDDASLGARVLPFDRALGPEESTTVTIDIPLTFFSGVGVEGVYPMAIELYDPSLNQRLDSFTTAAIYYPEEVEEERQLNVALVIPLSPPPARGPSGSFGPNADGEYPLEEALATSGWISGLLDALESAVQDGLSVGLAPSPRFVEEVAAMSDGYARVEGEETEEVEREAPPARAAASTLDQLESLLADRLVQGLTSPYSSTDFPTLYDSFSLEQVTEQLDAGRAALSEQLPADEFDSPWLYVQGSRWDERTLEQVGRFGDLRTFVDPALFEPPIDETIRGCPGPDISPQGSFTCPVEIQTDSAPVPAYVADPDVQARFSELVARDGDALYLQRLFAETALIHAEQPDARRRIIHTSIPSEWQPTPRIARRLLTGLARAPWLAPLTPGRGFARSVRPRERSIVEEVDPLPVEPGYFSALGRTAETLDIFAELGAPEQRRARLRGNLLVAEDRLWWLDPALAATGLAYATETEQEIEEEFAKITISGPDTTLTSQRSAIEVNVFNETTYPVTVDVDFESSRSGVRIDEGDSADLQNIVVEPDSAPAIRVDAIADTSGIFQVRASVESPGTGHEINHQNITIRSTNFNQIALGLTLGALVFLILFYLWRFIRRRRARSDPPVASATS